MSTTNKVNAAADAPSTASTIKPRLHWLPLKKVSATGKVTHPFLEKENEMDAEVVKVLLAKRPYKAAHKEKTKEWEKCASSLKLLTDKHGQRIFCTEVKVQTLKDRFNAYMKFVGAKKANADSSKCYVEIIHVTKGKKIQNVPVMQM